MTQPKPTPSIPTAVDLYSKARLQPYYAAARGNNNHTLQLYKWNIEVAGALHEVLAEVEVITRNVMDRELRVWNAGQVDTTTGVRHVKDWTLDPARLLVRLIGEQRLAESRSKAQGNLRGSTPGHDDVVAATSWGAWIHLLPGSGSDSGKNLLWEQALSKSFPHLSTTPRDLTDKMHLLLRARNRVAHHELVSRQADVQAVMQATNLVLTSIHPTVARRLTSQQRVSSVMRAMPVLKSDDAAR